MLKKTISSPHITNRLSAMLCGGLDNAILYFRKGLDLQGEGMLPMGLPFLVLLTLFQLEY